MTHDYEFNDDFDFIVWVIYDHPKDYPESFVVRGQTIVNGETIYGSPRCFRTLEDARQIGVPPGLVCLARYEEDDPVIIETWL